MTQEPRRVAKATTEIVTEGRAQAAAARERRQAEYAEADRAARERKLEADRAFVAVIEAARAKRVPMNQLGEAVGMDRADLYKLIKKVEGS